MVDLDSPEWMAKHLEWEKKQEKKNELFQKAQDEFLDDIDKRLGTEKGEDYLLVLPAEAWANGFCQISIRGQKNVAEEDELFAIVNRTGGIISCQVTEKKNLSGMLPELCGK